MPTESGVMFTNLTFQNCGFQTSWEDSGYLQCRIRSSDKIITRANTAIRMIHRLSIWWVNPTESMLENAAFANTCQQLCPQNLLVVFVGRNSRESNTCILCRLILYRKYYEYFLQAHSVQKLICVSSNKCNVGDASTCYVQIGLLQTTIWVSISTSWAA